jgi:hypothetical protein
MLTSIDTVKKEINQGKNLFLAGDENVLAQLPKGNWIGGTIPYFMDVKGGVCTREMLFVTSLPPYIQQSKVQWYGKTELPSIPSDAPENGFTMIIIPANSQAHFTYAQNAPNYEGIFLKPVIGWIAGVHLNDLGKTTPKVFNGMTGESSDQEAIVMHLTLPEKKLANISIINLFEQGPGDIITFDTVGFKVKDCKINGKTENLENYLLTNKINIQLPLVANYNGTMVNVSIQKINETDKSVDFYAPVFPNVEYRVAKPLKDYITQFQNLLPKQPIDALFSCNCILNYLYSELEGKKTSSLAGPITFGEIAYQLLNQTLVYLEVTE